MIHTKCPFILFIASSLDGYIATPDGDISFLSVVESPGEDYGYSEFIRTVDTVIMGRKTYDKVLSFGIDFPHKDKKCYVISSSRKGKDENVTYHNGNLPELIGEIRGSNSKGIFCDGGAEIVSLAMQHQLIDVIVISIIPVLLGNGIRLFKDNFPHAQLKAEEAKKYESGLVQIRYTLTR